MSKVFVNIGLSLDGYMAPEGMTLEHWETPEYKNWGAKWGALMRWILELGMNPAVADGATSSGRIRYSRVTHAEL